LAAWPAYFKAVDRGSRADAQDFARVVRCQVAAAGGFQPSLLCATCLPLNSRSNARGIASGGDELETEPVVPIAALVMKQNWGLTIIGNEYIQKSVIIKVADGHPASGKVTCKNRA